MNDSDDITHWKKTDTHVFWGEIAPCDHFVQIYENDTIFIELLTGFVTAGIRAGDCVIIIATPEHLKTLDEKLRHEDFDVFVLKLEDRLITLTVEEALQAFLINEWPDEILFKHLVSGLLAKARHKGRKVRAFGEIVAKLWAQGLCGATVQLEHLWHQLCKAEGLSLFCAYPRSGFTQDVQASIKSVCDAHSRVIREGESKTEIFHREVVQDQDRDSRSMLAAS